ncbi:hypothetical protein [Eleftheria terrae]|uniref:hypothetical protein n=1 Tax=Eleftheria terrae TaxID=1597781 RepID=UPI00263B1519|nr:hypothetical protein [Eleftheria terrae]WKB56149.1 hypothetical protein N7L95_29345 [Eleftheria terrae]
MDHPHCSPDSFMVKQPAAAKAVPGNGRRFAIALACSLFAGLGVATLLMVAVAVSDRRHMGQAIPLSPAWGALALHTATFFVMTKAWVHDRRLAWYWPVFGLLSLGVFVASPLPLFSILMIPTLVPPMVLAVYLCYYHLRLLTAAPPAGH